MRNLYRSIEELDRLFVDLCLLKVPTEASMRLALRLAICLLAVGCVKVKVQQWDAIERPIREPESISVLLAEPEEPYTVIAVIESSFEGALKGFDDPIRLHHVGAIG